MAAEPRDREPAPDRRQVERRRSGSVMTEANAISWSIPAARSDRSSARPRRPRCRRAWGSGIGEQADAEVDRAALRERDGRRSARARDQARVANRSSVATLPPSSWTSFRRAAQRPEHGLDDSGHQTRTRAAAARAEAADHARSADRDRDDHQHRDDQRAQFVARRCSTRSDDVKVEARLREQEQRARSMDDLDRRCRRTSRSAPDVTAVGRWHTQALEEPDAQRHPRRRRGQREVHERRSRAASRTPAGTAARAGTEPSVVSAWVNRGSWASTKPAATHPHDGVPALVDQGGKSRLVIQPISGSARQHQQCQLDQRPPGHPAKLREGRRFGSPDPSGAQSRRSSGSISAAPSAERSSAVKRSGLQIGERPNRLPGPRAPYRPRPDRPAPRRPSRRARASRTARSAIRWSSVGVSAADVQSISFKPCCPRSTVVDPVCCADSRA